MTTTADVKVRDQLKAVRDQLKQARSERVEKKKARDDAKDAFGNADLGQDVKVTETQEFKDAEQAVRELGEVDDTINDLQEAERGMLRLLGDSPAADSGGNLADERPRGGGWDGHRLLAQSDEFRHAAEAGRFTSRNQFGTVTIGEIASREEFRSILAAGPAAGPLPAAPQGEIGTIQGAIRPDVRGIVSPPLGPLTVLDIFPTGVTDSNIVQFVQVTAIPGCAAETAELAVKPEEGLTTVDATAPVRTIAGWVKLARQAMDDVAGLATLINTLLPHDVRRRLQGQMLAGDGQGQNLTGILNTQGIGVPQAAGGDNIADGILRAMTTIILSDQDPNFVALNPLTWADLLTMKAVDSGLYLFGHPGQVTQQTIWGLQVTANRFVPQATPLVGDSMGATLLVREGVNVRTSDSDQDDFQRNRITLLAETRVAFPVWRPSAFALAPLG